MSEAKHTPGPWRVDPKRAFRIAAGDDDTIATTGNDSALRYQWEANARLIAAAPDMLEALKMLDRSGSREAWLAARAAIAKAGGRSS